MKGLGMFEIGRKYQVVMTVWTSDGWMAQSGAYTVAAVDGSLVKLTNKYSPDMIVNTASWNFVSAQLLEERISNIVEDDD